MSGECRSVSGLTLGSSPGWPYRAALRDSTGGPAVSRYSALAGSKKPASRPFTSGTSSPSNQTIGSSAPL